MKQDRVRKYLNVGFEPDASILVDTVGLNHGEKKYDEYMQNLRRCLFKRFLCAFDLISNSYPAVVIF